MNWALSPRWRVEDGSKPALVGPDDVRIDMNGEQYRAIGSGRLELSSVAESDAFPDVVLWSRNLIASRVIVPEYLASGRPPADEAERYWLDLFEAVCGSISCSDIWPRVRDGLLSWSGTVLKQPMDAPDDYFPSRPALCIDLLGNSRRGVRVALDCRDPLLTPWENIHFARTVFERRLQHRIDLFESVCGLVFRESSRFTNPRVKYLHPAIDFLPDGAEISAYWNLGRADAGQGLWDRSMEIIQAAGGGVERQLRFMKAFGACSQPELIGHTFDPRKPPVLKTYVMFDGLTPDILREILERENVLSCGKPVMRALEWLGRNGLVPGKNVGIASLYHPLEPGGKSGVKIHLNLREGFERLFALQEITGMVGKCVGRLKTGKPFPEFVRLRDGRTVQVLPYTLSFMLVPGDGLTKITLYVNF